MIFGVYLQIRQAGGGSQAAGPQAPTGQSLDFVDGP